MQRTISDPFGTGTGREPILTLLSEVRRVAGVSVAMVEKPNKPNYSQRPIDMAAQV